MPLLLHKHSVKRARGYPLVEWTGYSRMARVATCTVCVRIVAKMADVTFGLDYMNKTQPMYAFGACVCMPTETGVLHHGSRAHQWQVYVWWMVTVS